MRILLVRHAEPDYSIDSLTEKGHKEAELLADRLKQIPDLLGCYVSPKGRAMDTAAYTLNQTGWSAQILPWLQEFRGACPDPSFGHVRACWDYLPRDYEKHPLWSDADHFLEDPIYQLGNVGKIWRETTDGLDALLGSYGYLRNGGVWLTEKNLRGTLVLFCHFIISMAIMAYLTHVSPVPLWQHFCCLPSSVTTLITEERVPGEVVFRCIQLGDLSHLYANGETYSTSGLFAEIYDGADDTLPRQESFLI